MDCIDTYKEYMFVFENKVETIDTACGLQAKPHLSFVLIVDFDICRFNSEILSVIPS